MSATTEICTTVLSNGITILTERMAHVRSVTTAVYTKHGSSFDPINQNGLAHLAEHLLLKGTSSRTAEQISFAIGDLCGSFNAFTTHEAVFFDVTVLDTKVAAALDLLSDLLLRSAFASSDIVRERGVIEQEVAGDKMDPAIRAFELYMRTQWPNSSLGLPIAGTAESIGSFTHDTLSNYAETHFNGRNIVIAAAGNLHHDKYVRTVEKYFGGAPIGSSNQAAATVMPGAGVAMAEMLVDQVHLVIGVPAPPLADSQFYTINMLASLLGQGACSRFYRVLRGQRGLIYNVDVDYRPRVHDGQFTVYAVSSQANAAEVHRLICEELVRVQTSVPTISELNRVKNQYLSSYCIDMESSSSRAHTLAGEFLALGRLQSQIEREAKIERVTAEQVKDVACQLFDVDRMVTVVAGNVDLASLGLSLPN